MEVSQVKQSCHLQLVRKNIELININRYKPDFLNKISIKEAFNVLILTLFSFSCLEITMSLIDLFVSVWLMP